MHSQSKDDGDSILQDLFERAADLDALRLLRPAATRGDAVFVEGKGFVR